jgi:hypothetical protein
VLVAVNTSKPDLHNEPVEELPIIYAVVRAYIDFGLSILHHLPISTVILLTFLATGKALYFHCYFNWLWSA